MKKKAWQISNIILSGAERNAISCTFLCWSPSQYKELKLFFGENLFSIHVVNNVNTCK